jgi:hypothetical protein
MNRTHMCWNGSSHVLKVDLLKNNETKIVVTYMDKYWEEMAYEDTKN